MNDPLLHPLEGIETLRVLIDNSPIAVYLANMEGHILLANQAASQMLGFSKEELLQKNVIDLDITYQNHQELIAIWNQMDFDKPNMVYGRHLCKNKVILDVEIHISKVHISGTIYLMGNVRDISERREWERRITRSEYLLNEAQRLAKIGYWDFDLVSNQLTWSDEVYKITQQNKGSFEPSYERFLTLVYPEDRAKLDSAFKNAIESKLPYFILHRLLLPDGNIKQVEERAEIYFDENGNAIRALGTVQDVTESIVIKEKLSSTYEMLSKLMAQVPGVVYQYRLYPDGRSCFPIASEGMYDIYEHHPHELVEDASMVFNRLHPDDKDRVSKEIYESAEKQTLFHSVFKVILPTKGLRWCKCDARPELLSDGSTLWYGIITDITERVDEHDRLFLSEERYRIVANNTYNWEFWEDEEGKLLYVSPSCVTLTGFTAEEFIQNPQLMSDIILTEDSGIYANHRHHVKVHPHSEKVEFRIRNKSGQLKYIKHLCQPAYDSKGAFRGIRGTNLDVTEAVENLQRIENLLKVEEAQNQRLRNFTHIVSHNLRSHSANMEGLLKLLKIESPDVFDHPYLKMMLKSSENLNETITHLNQVLDISLVNKEEWAPLQLLAAVKSVVDSVSTLAKEATLTITVAIDATIYIHAIPAYIDSIVLNMLTNAIKFCENSRDSYLHIKAVIEPGWLLLIFEDNGIGIDLQKHKEKIFGMYKIIHPRADSKGLGLFMTLNQVEAMGGKIDVFSEENIGTTFIIKLPYEQN